MHFHDGFEDIKVKLINGTFEDLAKKTYNFGRLAEFYNDNPEYDPNNKRVQEVIGEIISGHTFPKYAFDGTNLAFEIDNISRICLAQLTRERGFFCSASGDCRPLTQDFIIPKVIYQNKEWMKRLSDIEGQLEDLYVDIAEAGVSYMDARYIGLHSQTISLCYNASIGDWARSCKTRTENNFADEINYIYRLMRREIEKQVDKIKDPLSKKLWEWLLGFSYCPMVPYTRDATYGNPGDFCKESLKQNRTITEKAHNDFRNSSWMLELKKMNKEQPELLTSDEKEMLQDWEESKELISSYDPTDSVTLAGAIKHMDYYKK
mgnify:CR=1 FL=1